MPSKEERLAGVHPNALKRVSKDAVYVSAKRHEYRIGQDDRGYFYVYGWKGGVVPKALRGTFTSFKECERHLIQWLMLRVLKLLGKSRGNKMASPIQKRPKEVVQKILIC